MLRNNADARRCSYFELGLLVVQRKRLVMNAEQLQLKLRWDFIRRKIYLTKSHYVFFFIGSHTDQKKHSFSHILIKFQFDQE